MASVATSGRSGAGSYAGIYGSESKKAWRCMLQSIVEQEGECVAWLIQDGVDGGQPALKLYHAIWKQCAHCCKDASPGWCTGHAFVSPHSAEYAGFQIAVRQARFFLRFPYNLACLDRKARDVPKHRALVHVGPLPVELAPGHSVASSTDRRTLGSDAIAPEQPELTLSNFYETSFCLT
jgi:hypothetical protein